MEKAEAKRRFNEEMASRMYTIDVNKNGHVEVDEITRKSGFMTR